MKILDRLDELDYRLHLRRRPDAPRPVLTAGRIWFVRVNLCLSLLCAAAAFALFVADGPWLVALPAVGTGAISWASFDRETRRRIFPWRPGSARRR